ncbi:MAG: BrnA antitoxin family protein [Bdellovibrionota bacterium]
MTTSKKRLKKIAELPDSKIDFSDIPELNDEFWEGAVVVKPKPKKAISLRIDQDLLKWYKKKTKGKGYQSLIHAVLKSYADRSK